MSFPFMKQIVLLFSLCAFFSFSTIALAGSDWRPVSAEELAMKKGKVEADADAEAIFWEVRVDDASANLVMSHYVRLKIFNERGREKFSKVDIPFVKGIRIKDIEARVIKPDNTIIELKKEDIFEREIIKTNDIKIKAKSFAVPNIEEGVIVEYRYKEVYRGSSAEDMRLDFQRDIPMQSVVYYFKPYADARILQFNMNDKFVKDKGGFYKAEMVNVPAVKDEAYMPPADEIRSWLLIYYSSRKNIADSSEFWSGVGYVMAKRYDIKDTLKPGKKMKAAAEEIIAGAATDEEKVRKLFDFCKARIKNLDFDTQLTEDALDEIKYNKDDDDTYKKMQGRAFEINKLFASLADAAGFDTRIAFTGDRSKLFFDPSKAHESFIHMAGVAIKLDNRWKYFDPGSPFLPYGKLAWFEEDTSVFLLAYKDYITTTTPLSSYDESMEKRTGRFKLTEEGTLEGTVEIAYTGHLSYRQKMNNYDISENERETLLKDMFKEQMSTASISDIKIENITDPEKPFTYKFKVSVPNYAQKSGKRLFMQPGFFEYGKNPRFSSSNRKYGIYFRYPWAETDDIQIELPAGFELDNAEPPKPLGDNQKISNLDIKLRFDKATNILHYNRSFHFGGGGMVYFQPDSYQPLKSLFDAFHKADSHPLTLKKEEVTAAN
jgi:hypothetical protein